MKRYVKSANWLTNKATYEYAKRRFDENEILVRTILGRHDGNPMLHVFFNIIADPNVQIEDPERAEGQHKIFYNGKNIGWIDFQMGMGWIDDKAYDKIQKLDDDLLNELTRQHIGNIVRNRLGDGANINMGGEEFDDTLQYDDDDDGADFGGYLDDGMY